MWVHVTVLSNDHLSSQLYMDQKDSIPEPGDRESCGNELWQVGRLSMLTGWDVLDIRSSLF